jgi:diguanylate cyclase (GGDEF)-like protein
VLLLDLDHFKTINDTLGHELGDELLRQVARRLSGALPGATAPVRVGGDEFAVLVNGLSSERAEAETMALRTAENLAQALTAPFVIGDHELAVGASAGVVLFPGSDADETDLLR